MTDTPATRNFRVLMTRDTTESATVAVEAANPDEAFDIARHLDEDQIPWCLDDGNFRDAGDIYLGDPPNDVQEVTAEEAAALRVEAEAVTYPAGAWAHWLQAWLPHKDDDPDTLPPPPTINLGLVIENLHPIGDSADDPAVRLLGRAQILSANFHVEFIKVAYGTEYAHDDDPPLPGTFLVRASASEPIPENFCILGVTERLHELFLGLHEATGSEGWLETVFLAGREYAVFIYPFST